MRKSPRPHTVRSYRRGHGKTNSLVTKRRVVNSNSKLQTHRELFQKLRAKLFSEEEMPQDIEDMKKRRIHLQKTKFWGKKRGFGVVSMPSGRALYSIVKALKPSLVVETGPGMGTSSSYILSAMEQNKHGRLISVDKEPEAGEVIDKKLRHRWIFKHGESKEILPNLKTGKIDIFFHDSLHTYKNMTREFEWAYPRLRKGGLIVADDVTWNRSLEDFARKHNEKVHYIQTSPNKFRAGVIIKSH